MKKNLEDIINEFEKYWKTHGIQTYPAIMGLAFKECSKKAVLNVVKSICESCKG